MFVSAPTPVFNAAKAAPLLALALFFAVPMVAAAEADLKMGQELHEKHCVACHIAKHDATFYGRADRKATSVSGLQDWVRACASNFSLDWFDEEVNSVAAFINKEFYKFQ